MRKGRGRRRWWAQKGKALFPMASAVIPRPLGSRFSRCPHRHKRAASPQSPCSRHKVWQHHVDTHMHTYTYKYKHPITTFTLTLTLHDGHREDSNETTSLDSVYFIITRLPADASQAQALTRELRKFTAYRVLCESIYSFRACVLTYPSLVLLPNHHFFSI